jgi:hypothetical protein
VNSKRLDGAKARPREFGGHQIGLVVPRSKAVCGRDGLARDFGRGRHENLFGAISWFSRAEQLTPGESKAIGRRKGPFTGIWRTLNRVFSAKGESCSDRTDARSKGGRVEFYKALSRRFVFSGSRGAFAGNPP